MQLREKKGKGSASRVDSEEMKTKCSLNVYRRIPLSDIYILEVSLGVLFHGIFESKLSNFC